MADNIKLDLEENLKYRVAFELAVRIAINENKHSDGGREYWFKLYQQTRSVVLNGSLLSP